MDPQDGNRGRGIFNWNFRRVHIIIGIVVLSIVLLIGIILAIVLSLPETLPDTSGFVIVTGDSDPDFRQAFLECNNELRKNFDTPQLKLDPDLCKSSQLWANKLASDGDTLHHSSKRFFKNFYFTENIGGWPHTTGLEAGIGVLRRLYQECKHFNVSDQLNLARKPIGQTGHFVTMVSNRYRFMCASYASRKDEGSTVYVVIHYAGKSYNGSEVLPLKQLHHGVLFHSTTPAELLRQIIQKTDEDYTIDLIHLLFDNTNYVK